MRLRVPDEGETVVHDLIRGDTTFRHVHLDDPVIARADGSVLYNFAVAVDDLDAEITHVIRGEDHLSNTPKQLLVSRRWAPSRRSTPTCRCCTAPTARSSPSATAPRRCRSCATPATCPRRCATTSRCSAGATPTTRRSISTDELVERFRIERVSRNPARFDEQKLRWMNGRYMRELGVDELTQRLEGYTGRDGDLRAAVAISEEKMQTLADFWPLAGFIFDGPADDPEAREKWLGDDGRAALAGRARRARRRRAVRRSSGIEPALRERGRGPRGVKPRDVFQPVRVALAGTTVSRRASSRRSRCSAATRRCGASTPRSQPERLRPYPAVGKSAQSNVHTCR